MARHRKLTQKFAGFPIFKVGTSGDTFPVTSPFTTGFTGYGDGLSLDLQFAADKTLVARKGPTPVFTRSSGDNRGTTYFGPSSINAIFTFDGTGFNVNMSQSTLFNGRYRWENGDTLLSYNGTAWSLSQDGNNVATSALTSAFRPDGANWSGTAAVVTATSTLGIVRAANNEPRFDHDPVTLACKGLLIEESRTNLYSRSEEFNEANWTKTRASITANTTTAPNGTLTADKLVEDTSILSTHTLGSSVTPPATSHTLSVFAKKGERNFIVLRLGGSNDFFNLNTGVALTNVNSPTITDFGNGWYRCTVTNSAGTQGSFQMSADGITTLYTGDGTSGIFLWGAQLEAGSFPTSYIPTTTASLARSADVCSITAGAFTSFYNQTEGSLACNYSITAGFTGNRYAASIEDTAGGTQNGFVLRNTNSATSFIAGSGYTSTIGSVTTGVSKHILAYSGLTEFVYVKDSVVGTVTGSGTRNPSLPISMSIGSLEGGFIACGHIASLRYYKKRLSNAKLQAITV